jgi:hypothetical protein
VPSVLCRKYLGDNDATTPQLTCLRRRHHEGLCDNVRGDDDNFVCPPDITKALKDLAAAGDGPDDPAVEAVRREWQRALPPGGQPDWRNPPPEDPYGIQLAVDQSIARVPQKCRHFRGVQHETCLAGVDMKSVRDASQPGPYRWPCLTPLGRSPATTTCASFVAKTRAEEEAELAPLVKAVTKIDRMIGRGEVVPTSGPELTELLERLAKED